MKENNKMSKKIVIANDHAGVSLKKAVVRHLEENGYEVENLGCDTEDAVDYPDYANEVASLIKMKKAKIGILICGSGIGMSIAANKHHGIYAANCITKTMAHLARQHNNANVLCLGQRLVEEKLALQIVDEFLTTDFLGGRHEKRIDKIC
jgi:ribose 5-phosphate isomerase B